MPWGWEPLGARLGGSTMNVSLLSFAALLATVLPFRGRIGGYAALETVDDRSPALGVYGGVSSTRWIDAEIVATMAETVADPALSIDTSCIGCPSRGPQDCNRCAYFLAAIDKISLETVFAPKIAVTPTVSKPTKPLETVAHVPVMDRTHARKPALDAETAAQLFIAHIRESGKVQFTAGEFRRAYYEFVSIEGRRPTAENRLRAEVLKIAGVAKEKIWINTGKSKRRETYWTVQPVSETVAAPKKLRLLDKIPVIDRRAA